jgi:site-specific recombinase XerD
VKNGNLQQQVNRDMWLALEPQSKAQYDSQWSRYVRFARSHLNKHYSSVNKKEFPQFVAYLHNKKVKAATIRSAVSAISFNYEAKFLPSPTDSFAVKKLLLAYGKTDAPQIIRNPILQSVLLKVMRAVPQVAKDKYERIMLLSLFSFMYAALLRVCEISYSNKSNHNLKKTQVLLEEYNNHKVIRVSMNSCKFSKGPIAPMMISHNTLCPAISPVSAYESYLSVSSSSKFAFSTKEGRPLTPSYVRKTLRAILVHINHKSTDFNTHSFRIGRATDMYTAGFSDIQIAKAGRWNSKAFLKYIKPQLIQLS